MRLSHRLFQIYLGRHIGTFATKIANAVTPLLILGVLASPLIPGAHAQVPLDGLIGYWRGNRDASDSSSLANNGSFSGHFASGRPEGDAAFDLANAAVVIPRIPAYDFTSYDGWTVGFWFNTNGIPVTPNNQVYLGQDNGSGYQPKWFIDYGYSVYDYQETFVFHVNDSNQERLFPRSDHVSLPSGWNQLTVAIDNLVGTVSFFLNGTPIGTRGIAGYVLRTSAPLVFGHAEPGLDYHGLLNDVAIYNRVLTQTEIQSLAASCLGNFDRDGAIDFFDYLDFVEAFSLQQSSADFNHDGRVDFFDYLDFVNAFAVGC